MENRNPYREDFPLLANNPVIYLDSAATAQKPGCVLRAERDFYEQCYANPMRGFYELSMEATKRLEEAREEVRRFINAPSADEIIFTRNTTESLNLIAYSYGLSKLKAGDEILVSIMEHHSNLLPWQMAAGKTGAVLRFLECEPDGRICLLYTSRRSGDDFVYEHPVHIQERRGKYLPQFRGGSQRSEEQQIRCVLPVSDAGWNIQVRHDPGYGYPDFRCRYRP